MPNGHDLVWYSRTRFITWKRRVGRELRPGRPANGERVERGALVRRKKLHGGEHARPLVVPGGLLVLIGALHVGVAPRSTSAARGAPHTHTASRQRAGSAITPKTAVSPHSRQQPRSSVPGRSAIASFARAESRARASSSRAAAASRRRTASSRRCSSRQRRTAAVWHPGQWRPPGRARRRQPGAPQKRMSGSGGGGPRSSSSSIGANLRINRPSPPLLHLSCLTR